MPFFDLGIILLHRIPFGSLFVLHELMNSALVAGDPVLVIDERLGCLLHDWFVFLYHIHGEPMFSIKLIYCRLSI